MSSVGKFWWNYLHLCHGVKMEAPWGRAFVLYTAKSSALSTAEATQHLSHFIPFSLHENYWWSTHWVTSLHQGSWIELCTRGIALDLRVFTASPGPRGKLPGMLCCLEKPAGLWVHFMFLWVSTCWRWRLLSHSWWATWSKVSRFTWSFPDSPLKKKKKNWQHFHHFPFPSGSIYLVIW